MRRFILLGGLAWIIGPIIVVLVGAVFFYLYHATGLAVIVTGLIAP